MHRRQNTSGDVRVIDLREVDDVGFTTCQFLGPGHATLLLDEFRALGIDERHEFVATCNDLPRPVAASVESRILQVLTPLLNRHLPDHRAFLAGFLSKGPGVGAATSYHQDLTYTDEREVRSLILWIPLVDVDADCGALSVIPGSHRWTSGCRPGGERPLPTDALQDELAKLAIPLPVTTGHAVAYDPALVHGSFPNRAECTRVAVGVALAPRDAPLVHAHRQDDGDVTFHTVDAAYYTTQTLFETPRGYPAAAPWAPPVTTEELRGALQGPDRELTRPTSPPLAASPARSGRPRSAPVLTDERLDRRLIRDGFVTFPLIDPSLARDLHSVYGELHGWEGNGFEADLNNPDTNYRTAVSAALAAALDPIVTRRFERHRPFLRVFLCKWPGQGSDLYVHRDWMYTDERKGHRTYVVWIPLQDVRSDEGILQVVRGSHQFDPSPRGTDTHAPWMRHQEEIRSRLEPVAVPAGHAVVFDNQTIHASLPNLSGRPRLVVAIGVRDPAAPLVHFRNGAEGCVRYDVDERFFLTQTPHRLMEAAPPLEPVEKVELRPLDLDAAELGRALDGDLSLRLRRRVGLARHSKMLARPQRQIAAILTRTRSSLASAHRSAVEDRTR